MVKDIGFNTDREYNLKVIELSDITFNLNNGTCKPYKKQTIHCYTSTRIQTTLLK